MKKELGKWLLDIAKYIITAVVLSSFFNGFQSVTTLYIVGGIVAIPLVTIAVLLMREPQKNKNKKRR